MILAIQTQVAPSVLGGGTHQVHWSSFAEFLLVLKFASKTLRRMILDHKPVVSVYLGPEGEEYEFLRHFPTFVPVKDFKDIARYDQFSARSDVFLRLTELWRIEPLVRSSIHRELLNDVNNIDHLVWTMWLVNQHVDYHTNFKR